MRINCHTYGHWKNLLICAMSCPYTHRCKQFKEWRSDETNRNMLWREILRYLQTHPAHPYELLLNPLSSRKSKESDEMKRYVCIREEQVLLLFEEEITQHLLKGQMFDEIFELGREMELQIRLVPSKSKKKTNKTAPEADEVEESIEESVDVEGSNGVRKGRRKKSTSASA